MGHNLPLAVRRRLSYGIGPRSGSKRRYGASLRTGATGIYGNRATLTTALAGANNDLTFVAKTPGTAGNAITIAYVVAGVNTPLSVSVTGNAITVNVATNGASAATSTALEVRRAINFSRTAGPLVWARAAPQNDETGVVAAMGATALSGGAVS